MQRWIWVFLAAIGCGGRIAPPPNGDRLVVRDKDGRELTNDEIESASGSFDFEIHGKGNVPEQAEELHQQARRAGAARDYEKAIELLSQAQAIAPDWPYPTYDTAFTYLLMKDYAKAREYYAKTVQMSPRGYFTAITALNALDREANGELPEGTYAAYLALEWLNDDAQKRKVVAEMVDRLPQFAPAWKDYAKQVDEPKEQLAALEKGLAAKPDAETKGMLLINKALIVSRHGDKKAAVAILKGLAADPEATFANENLAKQVMATLGQ